MQTRYYDPEVGRFITIDDISYLDPETINGLNLYAYCGNNPVMYYDPLGSNWSSFWNNVGTLLSNSVQKILMVIGSTVTIVGGIALVATGYGATVGINLIGIGGASLVGGLMNEVAGGSFEAGWTGGLVSGMLSLVPGVGIIAGGFASSVVTDWIDNGWNSINWGNAGIGALFGLGLSVIPGIAYEYNIKNMGLDIYNSVKSIIFEFLKTLVTSKNNK